MSGPTCQDVRTVWVKAFSHNWGYQPGVPPPEQQQREKFAQTLLDEHNQDCARFSKVRDRRACPQGGGGRLRVRQWMPTMATAATWRCCMSLCSSKPSAHTQYTHSGC
mmetsp:Transcript_30655/g.79835  ORF Transcript_30655/g.79835 Transcript_30655/m.79835 type:complete len:108 (+) Transcript_30655:724-1047(+)